MSHQSAQTIRDLLKKHNLTQEKFAEIVELSPVSIWKYLKGCRIHPKAALKIKDRMELYKDEDIPIEKLID